MDTRDWNVSGNSGLGKGHHDRILQRCSLSRDVNAGGVGGGEVIIWKSSNEDLKK